MKLKDYVAVVWKGNWKHPSNANYDLFSPSGWDDLQKQANAGEVVILEACEMGRPIAFPVALEDSK